MIRTTCGVLLVLTCSTQMLAQRRVLESPNSSSSESFVVGGTPLQWALLSGALHGPASAPANAVPVNSAGGSTVSVATLKIPDAAMREMNQFQKDFDVGKLPESVKHLEKAIRIYPQWAAAHYDLGQAYARLHDYEKAIAEFRSAAVLDEHIAQPWVSMAALYLLRNEYDQGEDAARHALELDPSNTEAWYFLGRTMVLNGHDSPDAVELLQKSKDQYPAAHLVLANLYLKRSATDDALGELRDYLAQPNAPQKEKVSCMVDHLTKPSSTLTCSMN